MPYEAGKVCKLQNTTTPTPTTNNDSVWWKVRGQAVPTDRKGLETPRTGNGIPGSPNQTLKEVPDVDVLHLQQDKGLCFVIRNTR